MIILQFAVCFGILTTLSYAQTPVVLWHGMGKYFKFPKFMSTISSLLNSWTLSLISLILILVLLPPNPNQLRFTWIELNSFSFHITGDSCCGAGSLGKIIEVIQEHLPGVHVLSLKFGSSTLDVRILSLFLASLTKLSCSLPKIS